MNLNEAKQAAYSAANRASAKIKTMMQREPPATAEDARELVDMARTLNCAAEALLLHLNVGSTQKLTDERPETIRID